MMYKKYWLILLLSTSALVRAQKNTPFLEVPQSTLQSCKRTIQSFMTTAYEACSSENLCALRDKAIDAAEDYCVGTLQYKPANVLEEAYDTAYAANSPTGALAYYAVIPYLGAVAIAYWRKNNPKPASLPTEKEEDEEDTVPTTPKVPCVGPDCPPARLRIAPKVPRRNI